MAACDMFDFYFMGVKGPMTLFDLKGVKDRCSYARVSFTAVALVFHGGLHAPDDRKHLWLKEPPNMIAHQKFERCLRAGVLDPASGDVENPQPIGQVGIPRLKGTPHPYTTGRGLAEAEYWNDLNPRIIVRSGALEDEKSKQELIQELCKRWRSYAPPRGILQWWESGGHI